MGDGYDWRRPKMKTKKYAELPKLLACYKAFCVENCIPIYVSSSGRRQQRILLDCGWMGEMAHSKARMPWRPWESAERGRNAAALPAERPVLPLYARFWPTPAHWARNQVTAAAGSSHKQHGPSFAGQPSQTAELANIWPQKIDIYIYIYMYIYSPHNSRVKSATDKKDFAWGKNPITKH